MIFSFAEEGDFVNACCTVDNLEQATADGTLEATVNVLVCKTCGHQESYVYMKPDTKNALFSYCQFVKSRVKKGYPVFARTS